MSMGSNAATKLARVVDNTERVLAIELFNAAQALEFRRPLRSSAAVENFVAAYREVVPYMKEKGGSIINYCSMYGLVSPDFRIYGPKNPQKNPPNYGAAKAGVDQLTRYAASALAQYGIRVNAVTPGPFPAPNNAQDPEFNAALAGKTMLGRFGKNYEMAGAVLLLASDASSFTTGANYVVDGGWTAW